MGKIFLILVTVIIVLVILAFTGVQPFSKFKDSVITNISDIFKETKTTTSVINPPQTSETDVDIPSILDSGHEIIDPVPSFNEESSEYVPSFNNLYFSLDTKLQFIKDGTATRCKLIASIEATENNKPGYYTIELLSTFKSFGTQEFKYLRGDITNPLSWTMDGGDTWVALTKMQSVGELASIFNCKYSYSPFVPVVPFFEGTAPTTEENSLFTLINNYRSKNGLSPFTWKQEIQDDSRRKAMSMLVEGVATYSPLQEPYDVQLVFSSKTFSTETPESIAKKAFDDWFSDKSCKQIISSESLKSMAVGYVEESKESIYYIVVLFTE